MRRLLLTGARGFLGRNLIRRLSEDGAYELFAVTSQVGCPEFPENVSVEKADLLDPAEVRSLMRRVRPEICVHLAWDQRTAEYRNGLSNYLWLAASIQLFSEFQAAGGQQFLFASSSGEYEDRAGGASERPDARPMSLYGRCKKTASELFLFGGQGLQVQIARYFTIYGPGDTHCFGAIPSAIRSLLQKKSFVCSSPGNICDYVYIDDAAEATLRLLRSGYGGAVNIGSGVPRSMREVFSEISGQLGCPELVSYSGKTQAERILVADTALMEEVLQFRRQTPFQTGIARAIDYWRGQIGEKRNGTI